MTGCFDEDALHAVDAQLYDLNLAGDYAGGSFAAYCGWTQMQCEDYVRTKPEAFSYSDKDIACGLALIV